MDYESNCTEAELYRLRTKTRELEIEIDTLNTQNVRLAKENSELANDLNLRTVESNTATSINAELRMMLFKAQNERDQLNESLQTLKQKYNKLYDKYAVNDRQFRAINQTFRDVNRLGPVMRTDHSRPKFQRPESKLPKAESECDKITLELKKDLDQAYDKIEELEFELESLEVLEHENQQLRSELNQFEKQTSIDSSLPSSPSSIPKEKKPPPITPRKSLNMTSAIFNQTSTTQHKQQEHSTYTSSSSSSIILRTSAATISPSSNRFGTRYSTASTVTPEEIQGNTKSPIESSNETAPLPPIRSSSKFYVENENIYEPIGEQQQQQTTNVNTTTTVSNKKADFNVLNEDSDDSEDDDDDDDDDNVYQSSDYSDDHDDENLDDGSNNGSVKKKPNLQKKPSFVCGARQSIGGSNGDAKESNKIMINLVGELKQFQFKNSSQGPKNA